ncbi:MAG: ATP-binding cassette domain-containing protein [Yoonia sp.]
MLTCDQLVLQQGTFRLEADLRFQPSKVTAVMGPSGAGKSTLLSAVAGFVTPSSGGVSHNGTDLTNLPPGKRPMSVLFQDNNLFPHLTVRENVGLGLRQNRKLTDVEQQSVTEVLARTGIGADLAERKPAQLSGGQQSRVALARLLISELPIALLDEPFSALGPALKNEMLDLMRTVVLAKDSATVLMVTHDPIDARRTADEVVWVDAGVAHPPRATAELFADPPDGLRNYLGEMG